MRIRSWQGFLGGSDHKEVPCQCGRRGFGPWVGKIPWRRRLQPPPVSCLERGHGQRSLADCSPGGCREWDTQSERHRRSATAFPVAASPRGAARLPSRVPALPAPTWAPFPDGPGPTVPFLSGACLLPCPLHQGWAFLYPQALAPG